MIRILFTIIAGVLLGGVVPDNVTRQRPSSARPLSSTEVKNATPSPDPTGNSPLRAMPARA